MTDQALYDAWSAAAGELDVQLDGPRTYPLADGTQFEAEMRFVDFADLHGLVVLSDPGRAATLRDRLVGSGYTVAVLPPPRPGRVHTGYELAQFLRGTGWAGSEKARPEWM